MVLFSAHAHTRDHHIGLVVTVRPAIAA